MIATGAIVGTLVIAGSGLTKGEVNLGDPDFWLRRHDEYEGTPAGA